MIRLRLSFSHLNEHRFCHNVQDCMSPLSSCSLEVEKIKKDVLLYGDSRLDGNKNRSILEATLKLISKVLKDSQDLFLSKIIFRNIHLHDLNTFSNFTILLTFTDLLHYFLLAY